MAESTRRWPLIFFEQLGRSTVKSIEEIGYLSVLFCESLFWALVGPFFHQPVRIRLIFSEMVAIGLLAAPIVFLLSFAVGVMLAIQGIHTLKAFGAESQVVVGIALSVTREFGPLITSILIAGRSGSAFAARIGTMQVSQEIDALRVMSINPVRYLVSPIMIAMLVMVPTLTFFSDLAALFGGAVYAELELDLSYAAYWDRCLEVIETEDFMQGLIKSLVFAVIIALVGVGNGFSVSGGAEGVGRSTTRAVVLSISLIVIFDMIFTYFLNR
jgi:phospholipid/cholesterol/gamma-HCH transport system permease protein